jgi:predicted transcriptional regulator
MFDSLPAPTHPIWELLERLHADKQKVAESLGVSVATVSHWIAGRKPTPLLISLWLHMQAEHQIKVLETVQSKDRLEIERFIGKPVDDIWLKQLSASIQGAKQQAAVVKHLNDLECTGRQKEAWASFLVSQEGQQIQQRLEGNLELIRDFRKTQARNQRNNRTKKQSIQLQAR